MTSNSKIVVATSIPPRVVRYDNGRDVGQAYQRLCIESWIHAGFRVLSLNYPDELQTLAPRYPMVDFIPVDRDASAILGRKTPLLPDLLQVLSEQDTEIVGIINADILLEAKDWVEYVKAAAYNAIAVAHRWDTESLEPSNPKLQLNGYDLFFFQRKDIPPHMTQRFAMGLPWWDYCLPIAFGLRGIPINRMTSPIGFHLQHTINWNWHAWRYMANDFAEFVLERVSDEGPRAIAWDHLSLLIQLSREIIAAPAVVKSFPPSLRARTWRKLLSVAGRLSVFRRLASGYYRQDANLHGLAQACLAAISASSRAH